MIYWSDFLLDQAIGPVLVSSEGSRLSDAQDERGGRIQETRQTQQPARMVGIERLESAFEDKDVGKNESRESIAASRGRG